MAYQERYPLNDSPSGDTKREAILKNRQEMLNIADEIDKKSNGNGGGGGLRNRVLTGNSVGGQYNYLSGDNLSVTIDGTVTPIVVSFANGFDNNGAVDYVKSLTARVTPWSLPASATLYLYLDYNATTGAINYDSTTIAPIISNTTPDATDRDSNYYNELLGKSFAYNGAQWVEKIRVFVAKVITNSTSVAKIEYINRSDSTITSNMIGNATIVDYNLSKNSVGTMQLKDKSVTADKLGDDVTKVINNVLDKVYPVGSIYCSIVSTNPHTLFGFGAWEYIEQGRVLLSQGSNYKAGSTGGEATHTLNVNEMPQHSHSTNSAGDHTHTGTTSWADLQGEFGTGDSTPGVFYASSTWGIFSNNGRRGNNGNNGSENSNGDRSERIKINASHNHTFTTTTNGSHTHSITNTGGSAAHNNMQPYLAVYMWKRVS